MKTVSQILPLNHSSHLSGACYLCFFVSSLWVHMSVLAFQQARAAGYLSSFISFFDPVAFWGSGDSSHTHHPCVINNRLLSGDLCSFVFIFPPVSIQLQCMSSTIDVFWLAHTSKEIRLILVWGKEWGTPCASHFCHWAGDYCSVTLQGLLGPQMLSFSIKIISLDRNQEGFDSFFHPKIWN